MPYYIFETIVSLTDSQRDELAHEITNLHSQRFKTPRLFVNVAFQDMTHTPVYVAGKQKACNKLVANVRHGPSRTQKDWDDLCKDINDVWARIVGTKGDEELRAIFVLGGMIAGSEVGFAIPQAGEDGKWLKQNAAAFKKRADDGDEDFAEMLEEMKGRPELNGIVNGH